MFTNLFLIAATKTPNPSGFFSNMKGTTMDWVNAALDNFLIPVGAAVLAVAAIIIIIKAAFEHKRNQGDDLFDRLMPAIVCFVVIAFLLTKPLWWGLLGL